MELFMELSGFGERESGEEAPRRSIAKGAFRPNSVELLGEDLCAELQAVVADQHVAGRGEAGDLRAALSTEAVSLAAVVGRDCHHRR